QVREVLVAERHPEADAAEPSHVQDERLELFVMEKIRLPRADAGEVEDARDLHRLRLDPAAVFPVAAVLRDLAEVDLWVEVGRKRLAVAAVVAIHDVDR